MVNLFRIWWNSAINVTSYKVNMQELADTNDTIVWILDDIDLIKLNNLWHKLGINANLANIEAAKDWATFRWLLWFAMLNTEYSLIQDIVLG